MVLDKSWVLAAITEHMVDRKTTWSESGEPSDLWNEICSLAVLSQKVEAEDTLSFQEYLWLADIVANKREDELRAELE